MTPAPTPSLTPPGVPADVRAEVARLALLLDVDPGDLDHLHRFDAAEVRALRGCITRAVADDGAPVNRRLASIVSVVPNRVVARLAQAAMPPRLAAGLVAELDPDTAADVAQRLAPSYLARVCSHLRPEVAAPVVALVDESTVDAVCAHLVETRAAGEMAEMAAALDDGRLRRVISTIDDPDLLLDIAAATSVEGGHERLGTVISDADLARVVRHATSSTDRLPVALRLIAGLPESARRRLFADGEPG